ncbi:hypothetical protein [Vibrio sonorensis]|uniref:hypothetical protein n=1 Tax=Vibrio sonorensis TaxID=1004316 RepID=UPI0008DA0D90|nr:hypothetical protein [Vibrio sonorensis]
MKRIAGVSLLWMLLGLSSLALFILLSQHQSMAFFSQTQNHWRTLKQDYWQRYSLLECLAEEAARLWLSKEKWQTSLFQQACQKDDFEITSEVNDDESVVEFGVKSVGKVLKRRFSVWPITGVGVIVSNADLRLSGNISLVADAYRQRVEQTNSTCVAIRYSGTLHYSSDRSSDRLKVARPNSAGPYPEYVAKDCYQTSDTTTNNFAEDVVEDSELDAFYYAFGVRKTDADFTLLRRDFYPLILAKGEDCQSALSTIQASKVWIQGSCHIDSDLTLPDLNTLVIEGGVMAITAPFTMGGQFIHLTKDLLSHQILEGWQSLSMRATPQQVVSLNTVFYSSARFTANSGYYWDGKGHQVQASELYMTEFYVEKGLNRRPLLMSWVAGSLYEE